MIRKTSESLYFVANEPTINLTKTQDLYFKMSPRLWTSNGYIDSKSKELKRTNGAMQSIIEGVDNIIQSKEVLRDATEVAKTGAGMGKIIMSMKLEKEMLKTARAEREREKEIENAGLEKLSNKDEIKEQYEAMESEYSNFLDGSPRMNHGNGNLEEDTGTEMKELKSDAKTPVLEDDELEI